jgi:hypothetical protein
MSRFGSKAEISLDPLHVRFTGHGLSSRYAIASLHGKDHLQHKAKGYRDGQSPVRRNVESSMPG